MSKTDTQSLRRCHKVMLAVETAIKKLTTTHGFPKAVEKELNLQAENLNIARQDTPTVKG